MHVIFDLDGTLADTHPGIADAFGEAMREVLPHLAVPEFTHLIGPPVREVFRQALHCEDENILDSLNAAFRRHYDDRCWMNSRPYPKIPELLSYLASQSVGCSVLTNKPALATSRILNHFRLRDHFTEVISPDSRVPRFARKSEGALHLLKLRNLDPTSTWLIGDSEDDADAAFACGFNFAAAAYGYGHAHLQDRYPIHFTISSIGNLHSHLQHRLTTHE